MAIEEEPDAGIPEWVVTFGDMMSLLLTFFIMLVSMSEIKKDEQYQAVVESIQQQFGHDSSTASLVPGNKASRNSALQSIATMGSSQRRSTEQGGSNVDSVQGDKLKVQTVRPGNNSTLGGVVYFGEDDAILTESARRDLLRIVPQIAGKPQKIEIRGHTSRKPTNGIETYRDHWDLAYARCYATMQFLVEHGIESERFRLGAAGSTEPIDNGLSPDRRKRNARVEVLMWDERVAEAPST